MEDAAEEAPRRGVPRKQRSQGLRMGRPHGHVPRIHRRDHEREHLAARIGVLISDQPEVAEIELSFGTRSPSATRTVVVVRRLPHRSVANRTNVRYGTTIPRRGSNENANGPLRQYFPKGTDLSVQGADDLELVTQRLHGRPRKTLDWRTPAERLRDSLVPV